METDLMDEEPDLQIKQVHSPIFRKDRHLSSALITTEIEYMMKNRNNLRGLKREHRELLDDLGTKPVINSVHFFSQSFKNLKALSQSGRSTKELMTCMHIANQALRISLIDYVGYAATLSHELTPFILQCYQIKANFDQLVTEITYSTKFKEEWVIGKIRGCAYGNLHLVHYPEGVLIITHSHLVALRDCVNSWFSVLLYSMAYRTKYPSLDFYKEVEDTIQAGIDLVIKEGRESYNLLKLWPSLIISCILRDLELRPEFHETIIATVKLKETKFYKKFTQKICTNLQAMLFLELSGLWKCFGHPDIDMNSSVNTWIKKGAACKTVDEKTAQLMVWALRLEFSRQYYKEKKRWPVLNLGEKTPKHIVYCYKSNLWTETSAAPWRPEDFKDVIFEKNLDFDYHIDIADLLSDKSIIPSRAQWVHEYDKQAHRTEYGYFPKGPKQTTKSVIVAYLEKESITVEEVIKQLETGDIPHQWLIMVAVAKEREFKFLDARFFGKMCFEMRLYQTATEKNIADSVFKYIKHQSMTMNEEQLIRTIIRMNTPIVASKGESYVFITLDFSSWCTNFRHEAATPLFIELDRLFGLHNVYSFTHLFPMLSILIFQDRFSPPKQDENSDPQEGRRCYPYPEAWLEGLRQKGWTLLTILIILVASWRCGTSASLLGQGDNQVILLRIPSLTYLRKLNTDKEGYINQYLSVLEDLSQKLGVVIKLEETWWSSNLFEYSRKYHLKGAQVSGALKRISRLASEANQVIPSLNSDLSGLFSTGATAAAEDSTAMYSYYCTIVEAALRLRGALPWLKEESWEKTCCTLLLTRTLGGYPITIYSQFCTRAVQDVLSTNLHLVRTALRDHLLQKEMSIMVNLDTSGKRDFLSLIKDPQSLPLNLPVQPENFVKKEIKRGLREMIVNKDLKELFSLTTEEAQDKLVADLMKIVPCNPKLLNKVYALSNVGLQERWLGKFSNTRSIQQTAFRSWSSEIVVHTRVQELEHRFSEHLKRKKEDIMTKELREATCVTVFTQHLREKAWGIAIEGITMPPQQEQTKVKAWDTLDTLRARRAVLITEQSVPNLCMSHQRGVYTPYFGSATRLRAKRATLQVVEVGSMVSSIKQLMELISWVKGNKGMEELLTKMLVEKTTIDPEILKRYTRMVYSGSLTHRLPCPALKASGMSNQNLNHPSHYTLTSDTAVDYSKGGINYTICFQSAFLYALSTLAHFTELGISYPKQMALVFCCSTCTWIIPPEKFELSTCEYPGVLLPTRITTLHQKDVYERYPLTKQIGEEESYAVIMGRKFAAWIVKRRMVDKITSLENRALEESMTVSFVNLAEFCRLNVILFLKSFIFYCALFDTAFFLDVHNYYVEILEGGDKNPYDVMLESLKRCGHLRTLLSLQGNQRKGSYTPLDLRSVLFSIVTDLVDNLKDIITTAYIVTPDDDLPHVIRAVQVWLAINELPNLFLVTMNKSEFDSMIEKNYAQYSQILPATTYSEEETIALIRSRPVKSGVQEKKETPFPGFPTPIHTPQPNKIRAYKDYLSVLQDDAISTALQDLICRCGEVLDYENLVTLEDREGVYYSVVAHNYSVKGGYPHWTGNTTPHQEPTAITSDTCDITWNRDDYYCNAVKEKVILPNQVLLVLPHETQTLYDLPAEWQIIRRVTKGGKYPSVSRVFYTVAKKEEEECWIVQEDGYPERMVEVTDTATLGESPMTTLNYLREYLETTLSDLPCLHAYTRVSQLLGCVPGSLGNLILCLRQKIRQQTGLIKTRDKLQSATYEHSVLQEQRKARIKRVWRFVSCCHIVLSLITERRWDILTVDGTVPYHLHGAFKRLCWKGCKGSCLIRIGDIDCFKRGGVLYWNRYIWTLYQVEENQNRVPRTSHPRYIFT